MTEPVAAPVVLVPVPVEFAAPVELAPEPPVPDELEAQVTAIAWEVLRACAWPAPDDGDDGRPWVQAQDAVRTVLGLASGYLRGRVPVPLPRDLRAVLVAASTRYAWQLGRARGVQVDGTEPLPELPPFYGWLTVELAVLNRYRVRVV